MNRIMYDVRLSYHNKRLLTYLLTWWCMLKRDKWFSEGGLEVTRVSVTINEERVLRGDAKERSGHTDRRASWVY